MACTWKKCNKGSTGSCTLTCRCGTTFCSEACFVAAWYGEHKFVCPYADSIHSEVAAHKRSGAKALCAVALTRAGGTCADLSEAPTPPFQLATGELRSEGPSSPSQSSRAATSKSPVGRSPQFGGTPATLSERSTSDALSRATASIGGAGADGYCQSLAPLSPAAEPSSPYVGVDGLGPASEASRRRSEPVSAADFIEAGNVGSGSYGNVKKVLYRKTGTAYAMKVIPKSLVQQQKMGEYLEREAETQARLRHPYILRLLDRFDDNDSIRLLLEFAPGGSLFWALRKSRHFTEEQAAPVFAQVSSALDHLHVNAMVHRDVKPENILLCDGGIAKLADFGWCAEFARGDVRKTFCGTFDYLSPEMINDEAHDSAVDVWAMGVLLFEVIVGQPPFAAKSKGESVLKISTADFTVPETVSKLAGDVIKRLLVRLPKSRMTLKDALRHAWVAQYPEAQAAVDYSFREQHNNGNTLRSRPGADSSPAQIKGSLLSELDETLEVPKMLPAVLPSVHVMEAQTEVCEQFEPKAPVVDDPFRRDQVKEVEKLEPKTPLVDICIDHKQAGQPSPCRPGPEPKTPLVDRFGARSQASTSSDRKERGMDVSPKPKSPKPPSPFGRSLANSPTPLRTASRSPTPLRTVSPARTPYTQATPSSDVRRREHETPLAEKFGSSTPVPSHGGGGSTSSRAQAHRGMHDDYFLTPGFQGRRSQDSGYSGVSAGTGITGYSAGESQRSSVLKSLDTAQQADREPVLSGTPLGPVESTWKAKGGYEAVKNFVRKGPKLNPVLNDELEKTLSATPEVGRPLNRDRPHGWADAREISPVRTNFTPRPSTGGSSCASRCSGGSGLTPARGLGASPAPRRSPQHSPRKDDSDEEIAPLPCTWRR